MFKGLWAWLTSKWQGNKKAIVGLIVGGLDDATDGLTQYLVGRGLSPMQAKNVASDVIGWIKEYIQRQL